jgi:hypothetical protein
MQKRRRRTWHIKEESHKADLKQIGRLIAYPNLCPPVYSQGCHCSTTLSIWDSITYDNTKTMCQWPDAHGKPFEKVVAPPLTVKWVKFCYKKEYVSLLIEEPPKWHQVIVGKSRHHEDDAPKWFQTKIAYPQGDHDWCLFLCLVSALLIYIGLPQEASRLAGLANQAENLPETRGVEALKASMIKCAPLIGCQQVLNSSKKKWKRNMSVKDVTSVWTEYLAMIIPLST